MALYTCTAATFGLRFRWLVGKKYLCTWMREWVYLDEWASEWMSEWMREWMIECVSAWGTYVHHTNATWHFYCWFKMYPNTFARVISIKNNESVTYSHRQNKQTSYLHARPETLILHKCLDVFFSVFSGIIISCINGNS